MRFEHLIEINSPKPDWQATMPSFSRGQLWQGLMQRVMAPQRFENGPDRCECDTVSPELVRRTLAFGQHVLKDEVQLAPQERVIFTPEPHGETAPIRLTIQIEEPQLNQMVLRFIYEALGEQTAEESYYNDYRHSAWLHNDRDMVKRLREWLDAGELPAQLS